jgi:mono/diheme cytochrome c family protein
VVVVAVVLGAGVYVALTWNRTWEAPLPDLHASTDPAVIKRGEYFVFGPSHCAECHLSSFADFHRVANGERPPLIGGTAFTAPPLGTIYSKNLTPDPETGIGRYTDPQIARMMRYAVRPDGHASVQPLMPFENMSDEDAVAILSYLRVQPPVRHEVPANEWTLAGKIIKSVAPVFKPRTDIHPPKVAPAERPTPERGEYLARYVANCIGCHSPHNQLTFSINGVEFSGGTEMEPLPLPGADPLVWFIPPNLTPRKGSALDKFPDRDTFVARILKGGRQHAGSPMPWESFAQMSPEDAGALYEFLRTLPPADGPSGEPSVRH